MANFISEDNIEQAAIKLLVECHKYKAIRCFTESPDTLPDNSGRTDKKQVVLPEVLLEQLIKLNPNIPEETIKTQWRELCHTPATYDIMEENYKNYLKIKNGIDVTYQKNGKKESNKLILIDFKNPDNNSFHVVSQLWIKGEALELFVDIKHNNDEILPSLCLILHKGGCVEQELSLITSYKRTSSENPNEQLQRLLHKKGLHTDEIKEIESFISFKLSQH